MRPRVVVSVGCPSGIGPEVAVACAASTSGVLLVGDHAALAAAARTVGCARAIVRVDRPEVAFCAKGAVFVMQPGSALRERDRVPGRPTRAGGAAQLAWIDAATDLVRAGEADALVTGPASKEVIARSGAPGAASFLGHTEHLARRLRAREVVMAFATERLVTALVTTHLPLRAVPRAVTKERVAAGVFWLSEVVSRLFGGGANVGICALNPHAGEGGLLGDEEERVIRPGIALGRARSRRSGHPVLVTGPTGAETVFRRAKAGAHDGVLAMYHDQATIPMKLLGFGEAVNVSLGLPIVRTSVDHGTGHDIAGKGVASARGMVSAVALARRLCAARREGKVR